MKGKVQTIEWDEELENLSREKATADASRGERKFTRMKYRLSVTVVPAPITLRSQIKVPHERNEAADEQV
jgi:hypothetical protein